MFVDVAWLRCSSWVSFLKMANLINIVQLFLLHWFICFGGDLLFIHQLFLKNTWILGGFLSVPHLVDNYAKIVDEWGRNVMCDRILPSLFVVVLFKNSFLGSYPVSLQAKAGKTTVKMDLTATIISTGLKILNLGISYNSVSRLLVLLQASTL